MSEIILHHYPQSPVSEKVRVVLGIKGLAWRSVLIPRLPPKPDLMPLTGGYRKTPVMQIGADVYCDSRCIIAELERRFPEPTLFPAHSEGPAWGLSGWTDGPLFGQVLALVLGDAADTMPADFAADRGRLYFGPDYDLKALKRAVPHSLGQIRAQLGWLEAWLDDGRDFLFGPEPGLADALLYYLVWFIRGRYSEGASFLSQFARLPAWEERVQALGHGRPADLDAEAALEVARLAAPATPERDDRGDPAGLRPGDRVAVVPDDVGGGPAVKGEIVALSADDIAIGRLDARIGEVVVHFPRLGYKVLEA